MQTDKKIALITGITGQDGSYLTEFLLEKGYEVHGIVRRNSTMFRTRLEHLIPDYKDDRLFLHYGDLGDSNSLLSIIDRVRPQEIYNLAAQSHVRVSFDIPEYTYDINALGLLRLLEAVRVIDSSIKVYQASTSEMYGKVRETPQTELTPFHPRSPYACAKVCAHHIAMNYRESYGMFVSCGILFNHESPRRGKNFVTRKITDAVARISLGKQEYLYLGNLDARRDWGYAPEYVEAMWLMLQHDTPDDFVIATAETHTVEEFVETAFTAVGLNWRDHVKFDERFLRPAEVDLLIGDPTKAKEILGWQPKVTFSDLVTIMVEADKELVEKEI